MEEPQRLRVQEPYGLRARVFEGEGDFARFGAIAGVPSADSPRESHRRGVPSDRKVGPPKLGLSSTDSRNAVRYTRLPRCLRQG